MTIEIEDSFPTVRFRALHKGTQVGYADLVTGVEYRLDNLQVESEYKGKKIGTLLLKSVLKYAFDAGADKMTLEDRTQSNQFNPTKIPNDMYKKAGFVHTPGHPYFKDDMELTRTRYERNQVRSPIHLTRSRSRN